MMIFQISAKIDDFFMMIFQNFAKINDFSSYGKNDDLPSLNQIDDIYKILAKMMIFQNLVKIYSFLNFYFCVIFNFHINLSVECCGVVFFRQHFCGMVSY